MSDILPQEGSRLGPYLLERRLADMDPELGHVYESIHIETGVPALVLVPDAAHAWSPRVSSTMRARAEVSPPFLAMEVERTPGATARALHELTLRSIQVSGVLASVEDREDTAVFLARGPAVPPSRRRALTRGLAILGCAALVLGGVWLGSFVSVLSPHDDEGPVARRTSGESVHWSQRVTAPPTVSFPLPSTPLKEQQKPPCLSGEEEINGGCWVRIFKNAPCDKGYAEHQGKCYMPVRPPAPEPRSVEP